MIHFLLWKDYIFFPRLYRDLHLWCTECMVLDVNVWYRHSGVGWTVDTSKHCQSAVCVPTIINIPFFFFNNLIKATTIFLMRTNWKHISVYTKKEKIPFDAGSRKFLQKNIQLVCITRISLHIHTYTHDLFACNVNLKYEYWFSNIETKRCESHLWN